jgi:hypothetical protein
MSQRRHHRKESTEHHRENDELQPHIADESGDVQDEQEVSQDGNHSTGRSGRKIRVRKRIRIRKKPSAKKKLKKYAERAFWVLVVVGFITALIILVMELDIRDDRYKKAKPKKNTRTTTF